MTDLERLRETFTAMGLPFREVEDYDVLPAPIGEIPPLKKERHDLILNEGAGYYGFEASFQFDAAGKFLRHSVYE